MSSSFSLPAIPENPARASALDTQGAALIRRAEAIRVVDQASLQEAAEFGRLVKAYLAEVEAFMRPIVMSAFVAHRTATAQREALKVHAVEADTIVRKRMGDYHREQDRLRRLAKEQAQHAREEAERQERERVAAENARRRQVEEDRRIAEAALLEARGDRAAAERLIAEPVVVPAVAPRPVFLPPVDMLPAAKVDGVSFGEDWDFEIIQEEEVPRCYTIPDRVAIGKVVRAMKGRTVIPGVRVFPRTRTSIQ